MAKSSSPEVNSDLGGIKQVHFNGWHVEMCRMQIHLSARLPPNDIIKIPNQRNIMIPPQTLNISQLHCFPLLLSIMSHKHTQPILIDSVQSWITWNSIDFCANTSNITQRISKTARNNDITMKSPKVQWPDWVNSQKAIGYRWYSLGQHGDNNWCLEDRQWKQSRNRNLYQPMAWTWESDRHEVGSVVPVPRDIKFSSTFHFVGGSILNNW
jgi:hypothetical protein